MAESRTFKLTSPHMSGTDVRAWQQFLVDRFRKWDIDYELAADGDYGQATRAATASFMRAWGVASAADAMQSGVTPWWRTKLRDDRRSSEEQVRFDSDERKEYRRRLRKRFERRDVCYPVPNLIEDSWGWHGTGHDGVDLICPRKQPVLAICRAEVVRADAAGWSGAYAPLGDGIVILRCLVDVGPFFEGLCFGYGHAENARVRAGETVRAGQVVAEAGFANASHLHFMANGGGFPAHVGHGDRDPMPFLDFAAEG